VSLDSPTPYTDAAKGSGFFAIYSLRLILDSPTPYADATRVGGVFASLRVSLDSSTLYTDAKVGEGETGLTYSISHADGTIMYEYIDFLLV
jgi:hypothetical protein